MNRDPAGTNQKTEAVRIDAAEDAALVARVLAGETHRYTVLVERYQRRLYWSCLRLLDDPDEAEDAVQETFVSVYEHLGDYDPRYHFYTWIYRIARNRCLNVLRRRRLWRLVTLSDPEQGLDLAAPGSADREAEDRQLAVALEECRRGLPAEQREVFDLRHADGFSYGEIGAALGIPQGTVMSRLARARQKMRSCLESKGVRGED